MLEAKESVKGKCARRDSVEQMSIDTPTLIHPRPELQNVKKITRIYSDIDTSTSKNYIYSDVDVPKWMHNVTNLHVYTQIDTSTAQSFIVKKNYTDTLGY